MGIQVGAQLGPYEITRLIGKGGMGEVYRARDTKLKRDVAIKILPDEFSRDPERLARFQREAEALAALNHTNIAAIYDLDEANGSRFLVLELVEGETIAERIRRGPMPINEALSIAKNICEALEAAHEKGIVHRDLKPANIKLTPAGQVKVLDFGLAKVREAESAADLSNSPTLMSGSLPGVIMGTAAYMSPEQARGKQVDRSADIWSFGCVLYELLTGQLVFQSRQGDTVQDIIAKVLQAEPDWTALPETTPPAIRALLRRCLRKDIAQRSRDATELRLQIEEATLSVATASAVASTPQLKAHHPIWRRALPYILTSLVAAAITAGVALWNRSAPAPRAGSTAHLVISLPPGEQLADLPVPMMALSPDGSRLAYVARSGNAPPQLYIRTMDNPESRALPGTEGAATPFFSPDGQWLGFFTQSKLQKIWVAGGSPVRISNIEGFPGGATWAPDDTIVFQGSVVGDLWRVAAAGGEPHQLNNTINRQRGIFSQPADGTGKPERLTTSQYPQSPTSWSPDGQVLLLREQTEATNNDIWALRLNDRKAEAFLKTRFNESPAMFSPDGHWVAYASFESGQPEIYVQPFPEPGGKWQISTDGGREPVWNPNGRELFYRNGNKMMVVDITTQPGFAAGKPRLLFEGSYVPALTSTPNYDVSRDGQRFLMLKASQQQAAAQIHVVLNWFEELKRRVPAGVH